MIDTQYIGRKTQLFTCVVIGPSELFNFALNEGKFLLVLYLKKLIALAEVSA
jgi:hypothetical protein